MKKLLFIPIFAFLGQLIPLAAQQIQHLGLEEGLSSGFVFDFLQSKEGFIYIGLHTGINRYDGYSIEQYAHNPFDTFSISPQAVNNLWEDERGYIWIGMESGALDVFNPRTNRFHHLGKFGEQINKNNKAIIDMVVDSKGSVWLALISKKIIKIRIPKSFNLEKMPAHIAQKSLLIKEIKIEASPHFTGSEEDHGTPIRFLLDAKENLWVGTGDGQILKIGGQNHQQEVIFQINTTKESRIENLYENSKGEIWFLLAGQFYKLVNKEVQIQKREHLPSLHQFKGFDEKDNFIVTNSLNTETKQGIYRLPANFFEMEQPVFEQLFPKIIDESSIFALINLVNIGFLIALAL